MLDPKSHDPSSQETLIGESIPIDPIEKIVFTEPSSVLGSLKVVAQYFDKLGNEFGEVLLGINKIKDMYGKSGSNAPIGEWIKMKRHESAMKVNRAIANYHMIGRQYSDHNDSSKITDAYMSLVTVQRKYCEISSPFLECLLGVVDDINTANLIEQIKDTFGIITSTDHIATAEKALSDCSIHGVAVVIKDEAKNRNDPLGLSGPNYSSSDEFMMALTKEIGERRGLDVKLYRGIGGFINFIIEYKQINNLSTIDATIGALREKGFKFIIIDDASYSGTQKGDTFNMMFGYSQKMRLSEKLQEKVTDGEVNNLNNYYNESARLYLAGATAYAQREIGGGNRTYIHRRIPVPQEMLPADSFMFIKHLMYLRRVKTTATDKPTRDVDASRKTQATHESSKPLVVSAFGRPDWVSVSPLMETTDGSSPFIMAKAQKCYPSVTAVLGSMDDPLMSVVDSESDK